MNYIVKFKSEIKKLYYRKVLMLKSTLKLPYVNNMVFNDYYIKKKKDIEQEIDNYYNLAVDLYDILKANGSNYEYMYVGNISLNKSYLISLYFDNYVYLGGAHGDSKIIGNAWDMGENKLLNLSDLFVDDNYNFFLIKLIKLLVKTNNYNYDYFDDLDSNIEKYFNEGNFYLEEDSLVIYYDLYTLAPYSNGIIKFKIGYDCLLLKERYKLVLL